ncbi:MAG TPA: hypothetical protein VGN34_32735 [Ktedonobacteraceae bacterium]
MVKYKTPLLIVYALVNKQAGSLDQPAGTPHGTGWRSGPFSASMQQ